MAGVVRREPSNPAKRTGRTKRAARPDAPKSGAKEEIARGGRSGAQPWNGVPLPSSCHDPSTTRPDAPEGGAKEKSRAAAVGMTGLGDAPEGGAEEKFGPLRSG